MVIIGSIAGAVFVSVVSYGTALMLEKQRGFVLKRKKLIGIEAVTAAVMLAVGMLYFSKTSLLEMIQHVLFLAVFLVIAAADWEYHVIPNNLLCVMFLLWIGIMGILVISMPERGLACLAGSFAGALAGGSIFLLCYFFSKGQMGAGDVKLAFVMGLYLTGDRIIGAVFYGVMLCLLYSLIQLIRKRIGLKDGVPMAPFLYLGTLFTYLITA